MTDFYQVEPVIIDRFTSSISGKLNTEFTTISISSVFPFRTNTLLKDMII